MYFIFLYYNKILKFCNAENIIPLVTRLKDFKCCILKEQIGLLRSDQVKDLIQNEVIEVAQTNQLIHAHSFPLGNVK